MPREDVDRAAAIGPCGLWGDAVAEWLGTRLHGDGPATLRRNFGHRLCDLGREGAPQDITEYDELVRLTSGRTGRGPHELLDARAWSRLIKPYLPGGPGRDMEGKDWFEDAPDRRFAQDVRADIEARRQRGKRT
jgi:hypothetical protein